MRHRFLVLSLLLAGNAMLCNSAERQPALSGQWEGAVQIPGEELRLVIDIAKRDQQWVGSFTAPQFGLKGTPLTGIAVKENDVEFALKGGATIRAHLETGGVMKGEYQQGGNTAPVLLKRAGEARVDFPDPSTPVSKDLQGEWEGDFSFLNSKVKVLLKLPGGGTPTAPAGELLVVDWGNTKMPITLWKQDGNRFFALLGDGGWNYEGEFRRGTCEITGNLRVSFIELPLTLHPSATDTAAPATSAAHPETK